MAKLSHLCGLDVQVLLDRLVIRVLWHSVVVEAQVLLGFLFALFLKLSFLLGHELGALLDLISIILVVYLKLSSLVNLPEVLSIYLPSNLICSDDLSTELEGFLT